MLRRFVLPLLAIICLSGGLSGCGVVNSWKGMINDLKESPDLKTSKSPSDPDVKYDVTTNTLASPLGGYVVYFPEQPTQELLHRAIGAITHFCWTGNDLILETISYPDSSDAKKNDGIETTRQILNSLCSRFEKQHFLTETSRNPVVLNTRNGGVQGMEVQGVTRNEKLNSCKFQVFIDTTQADAAHDVYLVATGTVTTLHSQYCRHFFDSLSFPSGLLKSPKPTPAE